MLDCCQDLKYGVTEVDIDPHISISTTALEIDPPWSKSTTPQPEDFCFGPKQVSPGMTPNHPLSLIDKSIKPIIDNSTKERVKAPWFAYIAKVRSRNIRKAPKEELNIKEALVAELRYYQKDLDDPGEGSRLKGPYIKGS